MTGLSIFVLLFVLLFKDTLLVLPAMDDALALDDKDELLVLPQGEIIGLGSWGQ